MTQSHSRLRQQAEAAFEKTQGQFPGRQTASQERLTVADARDEKINRLRAARLAKEQQDRLAPAKKPKRAPNRKAGDT